MRILHYTLGLPPYRSGGLTKYSQDLMVSQQQNGHEVFLLFPGSINYKYPKTNIHFSKIWNRINVYEINNPMPVPLLYGIKEPKSFINNVNVDIIDFIKFIDIVSPEIFHIHTLMGLPLEYIQIAKEKKIKLVYTTHDYFGLCPKVNFIDWKNEWCQTACAERCLMCNKTAHSTLYLRIRNMKFLTFLKRWK